MGNLDIEQGDAAILIKLYIFRLDLRLNFSNFSEGFSLFFQAQLFFRIGLRALSLRNVADALIEVVGSGAVDYIECQKMQAIITIAAIIANGPVLLKQCGVISQRIHDQVAHTVVGIQLETLTRSNINAILNVLGKFFCLAVLVDVILFRRIER